MRTFIKSRDLPDYPLYLTRLHLGLDLSLSPHVDISGYPADWSQIASFIKDLSHWRCEHCGFLRTNALGRTLGVHHLDLDKLNSRYANLISLCSKCHLYMHAVHFDFDTLWIHTDFVPLWVKKRGLAAFESRPALSRDILNIP